MDIQLKSQEAPPPNMALYHVLPSTIFMRHSDLAGSNMEELLERRQVYVKTGKENGINQTTTVMRLDRTGGLVELPNMEQVHPFVDARIEV